MTTPTYILPRDRDRLVAFIDRLPKARKFTAKVEPYKRKRTNPQNNALWGVAYPVIRQATGNEPDDLHNLFCGEYFGWVEADVLGKKKMKPRRTTTRDESGKKDVISTADFADFYTFIQMKAAEFGIDVPSPGELEGVQ